MLIGFSRFRILCELHPAFLRETTLTVSGALARTSSYGRAEVPSFACSAIAVVCDDDPDARWLGSRVGCCTPIDRARSSRTRGRDPGSKRIIQAHRAEPSGS